MVIINLHWNDSCSKTGTFCKHKPCSLHYQAVESFIVSQEADMMPDNRYLVAKISEKVSNRKYLLKVSQTVRYLARPG